MGATCPMCYDQYNDKDKIPSILQCGHTFCQSCLMDLFTSNILTCLKCFAPNVKHPIKNFTKPHPLPVAPAPSRRLHARDPALRKLTQRDFRPAQAKHLHSPWLTAKKNT